MRQSLVQEDFGGNFGQLLVYGRGAEGTQGSARVLASPTSLSTSLLFPTRLRFGIANVEGRNRHKMLQSLGERGWGWQPGYDSVERWLLAFH